MFMLEGLLGRKRSGPAKRVLVVEDDALLSKAMSAGLSEENFEVMVVENGLKVKDATLSFRPDVILLDMIIPGIDGFAVLKDLKNEKKTSNIPIAVISNLGSPPDIKSAKVLGADEYFIKANTEINKIVSYVKRVLKV